MEKESMTLYLPCPLCDADIVVEDDMHAGDDVYCSYCEAPLKLGKRPDDRFFLTENF